MIRPATFGDIPRLVSILEDAHARSHYAESSVNVDAKEAKRILVNAIQRHGTKNGGSFVMVAETAGKVEGFILGVVARIYHVGDRLMASDLFWICTPDVDPRDPVRLMKAMIAWAKTCPGVVEVQVGSTSVVQDPEKSARILEAIGMKPYGLINRMEIEP